MVHRASFGQLPAPTGFVSAGGAVLLVLGDAHREAVLAVLAGLAAGAAVAATCRSSRSARRGGRRAG